MDGYLRAQCTSGGALASHPKEEAGLEGAAQLPESTGASIPAVSRVLLLGGLRDQQACAKIRTSTFSGSVCSDMVSSELN